jgi:hypothetical protein
MKKKSIKNLELKKRVVSNFQEKLNGGRASTSMVACPLSIVLVTLYTLQDESMCWE